MPKEVAAAENPHKHNWRKRQSTAKPLPNPYNAASYGYIDDGIIEPHNTRC